MPMTDPDFIPLKFNEKRRRDMIDTSQAFYLNMKKRRTVRQFSDRSVPDEVISNAF